MSCSPWGHEESDTTQWLPFHFSLSCIGEGNGNPLQWSCLENPRDGGAWWAAVYGVALSWTWLKRLSISRKLLERVSLEMKPFLECILELHNFYHQKFWTLSSAYNRNSIQTRWKREDYCFILLKSDEVRVGFKDMCSIRNYDGIWEILLQYLHVAWVEEVHAQKL